MRVVASSFIAAGVLAGSVAAVVAYQSATSVADQRPAASVRKPAPVRVQLLPCEPGTRLVHGTCVRVVRRVVVHQAPVPARPAAPIRVARVASSTSGGPGASAVGEPRSGDDSETSSVVEPEHEDAAEQETEGQDD